MKRDMRMEALGDTTSNDKCAAPSMCYPWRRLLMLISSFVGTILLVIWQYGGYIYENPFWQSPQEPKVSPVAIGDYTGINPDDTPWSVVGPVSK